MTYGWGEKYEFFAGLGEKFGTLEAWSSAANMLFAAGCEAQAFALLASFAAPLMPLFPFSAREGGAIVSIIGGRRSGKSVAMTAAASVWGIAEKLELKGRDRAECVAALKNMPVLTERLAHSDPVIASNFLSHFIGEGKRWSTILLSFSGESLCAYNPVSMCELEVSVPRGLIAPARIVRGVVTQSVLERKLQDNRGNAGPAFIALLDEARFLWVKRALTKYVAVMVDDTGCDPHQYRYQLRTIAAAWVAGILCAEHSILECSPERIARWAMHHSLPRRPLAQPASRQPRPSPVHATPPDQSDPPASERSA